MWYSPRHPRAALGALAAAALAVLLASAGCGGPGDLSPVQVDRDALGTVVTIHAFGRDEAAVRSRVESAFGSIAEVEAVLDAYDESSTVSQLNERWERDPSLAQTLPPEAVEVFGRVTALDVADEFSPALWGVSRLYGFGDRETVPTTQTVAAALGWRVEVGEGADGPARFEATGAAASALFPAFPGLDFGGAAKGLALDRAVAVLRGSGIVDAALVTAGSTTLTFGEKPEGEPWRIGIEDPREPGRVIAVVEASSAITVSTSGDYQQHFERAGVNWHHILDPATGRPARGLRSLTVIGAEDGLSSDILSTALFVMGPRRAADYAREHALCAYMVDDVGTVIVVHPPRDARYRIIEQELPRK